MSEVRIALVMSAGGLRGAAHVGVLRRLVQNQIPISAIVGVSAGAIIAAYYAAVGLDVDELLDDARRFRGRHLLTYSLNVHSGHRFERRLDAWCGVIPSRLRQLEAASFDRLHHNIKCLGIVCHDASAKMPRYFSTGFDGGVRLDDVARASASIPHLFPLMAVTCGEEVYRLTDGGVSDPVPVAFAQSPAIGATHVIVSDSRWIGRVPPNSANVVWIRPRMLDTGTLWSPRNGLVPAVESGERAASDTILSTIDSWLNSSVVTDR